MREPYQFAFHDRVSKTPPANSDFDLVKSGVKLNREQKDKIFDKLVNNSGRSEYRLGGWAYPFGYYMKTYLVKYMHNGWQEIKAFDKMCIRNNVYINSHIIKIIELKE